MKNKTLIAGIVAVVLIAGGAFAFISMNKDDSKDTNANQSSQQAGDKTTDRKNQVNADNPLGIDLEKAQKGPYRMNITTTTETGESSTMTFDVDKDGDMKSTVETGTDKVTMIFVDNVLYTQNPEDGTWIKLSTGTTDALEGALTKEDIEAFKNSNFTKTGTGSCAAGTCDIYEGTDPTTDGKTIMKIDRKNDRISDMETTTDGTRGVFSFDYSVNIPDITAPEGATELNIPDLNDLPR